MIKEATTYGVVHVGTDHEAFTTTISTMVDGDDVAGLFIRAYARRDRK